MVAELAAGNLREVLFGDLPIDHWVGNGSAWQEFPWSAFVLARARLKRGDHESAINNWREVVEHPELESRHYLQAWHFLRQSGYQPSPEIARQVLGIVVEVGMPKGLDLLAAYRDHSARYYNYSGAGVVWEHPDDSLDGRLEELLAASAGVVAQIGLWKQERPPAPPPNQVRLSFLTPSGLHFGQAPMDIMAKDPRCGCIFHLAAGLMQALINRDTRH